MHANNTTGSTPRKADDLVVPEVSVIVPIYNKAKYLEPCLESVLAQERRSIEVICVDDASTDGSAAILSRIAEADPRVTSIINASRRGAAASRNRGLRTARGEWVQFTDADDMLPA